ncbi:MAG: hypothetical protein ACREV5_24010 [Steroidobacter sp.]
MNSPRMQIDTDGAVLRVGEIAYESLAQLFSRYGVQTQWVEGGVVIPGSYWGESEAGLVGACLFLRSDTPVHSALHETCHYICMDSSRRVALERDAGGDHDEENAVCYLQILLADHLETVGRERICADMDAWGYTFRLGSAEAWFEHDAEDARQWLIAHSIIDATGLVSWRKR